MLSHNGPNVERWSSQLESRPLWSEGRQESRVGAPSAKGRTTVSHMMRFWFEWFAIMAAVVVVGLLLDLGWGFSLSVAAVYTASLAIKVTRFNRKSRDRRARNPESRTAESP